jgi:hypothetical protein
MKQKVEVYKEDVLAAAKANPNLKATLENLFPTVFEDDKVLCKVGCVFTRKGYPMNFYAVMNINGYVHIVNISYNTFWNKDRALRLFDLKDRESKTLTVAEFKALSGQNNISEFEFYSHPHQMKG